MTHELITLIIKFDMHSNTYKQTLYFGFTYAAFGHQNIRINIICQNLQALSLNMHMF